MNDQLTQDDIDLLIQVTQDDIDLLIQGLDAIVNAERSGSLIATMLMMNLAQPQDREKVSQELKSDRQESESKLKTIAYRTMILKAKLALMANKLEANSLLDQ